MKFIKRVALHTKEKADRELVMSVFLDMDEMIKGINQFGAERVFSDMGEVFGLHLLRSYQESQERFD